MSYVSTALTTDRVRELASRGQTVASGSSVSSTSSSANAAYLAAVDRARVTREFRAAQTQTARTISKARTAQMISVTENEKVLPNFDAQSEQFNQNNNVNPSSLYTNQPVNVTGQGQSSVMDYGLSTNANYNYATQMNDYQSANPQQSVNLNLSSEPYFTAGLSSIPDDNEVKTSLLGGDIQHQETDVNTNLEYELPLSQQSETNVNWATAGASIVPIAAIGGLAYAMRKKL
tara:strand:+ start:1445 stop:2140 length:696 start_codon:yes stop_codon:yes gene_type:complete